MPMRFTEVTAALGAIIQRPGHPEHGKPLNVAAPHMATMRIWNAVYGGYSWSIAFEPGVASWSDEEKLRHVGYTASYRRLEHNRSSQTVRIDGGPWDTFTKAEDACKAVWRQIRSPS